MPDSYYFLKPRKLTPEEIATRRQQMVLIGLRNSGGVLCDFNTEEERTAFKKSFPEFYPDKDCVFREFKVGNKYCLEIIHGTVTDLSQQPGNR